MRLFDPRVRCKGLSQPPAGSSHLRGVEGALAEGSDQKSCRQLETEEDREAEESSEHEALATLALGLMYSACGLETPRVGGFMRAGVFGVQQPAQR